jgi:hypothetical protein
VSALSCDGKMTDRFEKQWRGRPASGTRLKDKEKRTVKYGERDRQNSLN